MHQGANKGSIEQCHRTITLCSLKNLSVVAHFKKETPFGAQSYAQIGRFLFWQGRSTPEQFDKSEAYSNMDTMKTCSYGSFVNKNKHP